jgi:hypothetical protein
MTTTSLPVNKTVNTVAASLPGYGAVPTVSIHPPTVGQVYTTTGTGAANWITPTNYDQVLTVNAGKSCPTLEVKGNLVINGVDLEERLNTMEKLLQIPERDVILEKKHPKLKKMYNDYIRELSKYRMWETIKGDDDGTT